MSRKTNLKIWSQFLSTTEKLNSAELDLWFDILLTPAEKEDIKDRLEILKGLLEDSLSQRELAESLGVSISKITRGSNALKRMSNAKKQWLKQCLKQSLQDSQ
jgi:TrpR family trp operon transcriptional repressor